MHRGASPQADCCSLGGHHPLVDPAGALRVAEVFTDNAGAFQAMFDLRYEPSLESNRKKWKKAKAMVKGTYRGQARIVVADDVASAESAMVFINR